MSVRARLVVVILFSLALVGGWASAQVIPQRLAFPVVLSGNDVGFRIEARRGEAAVGRLVVRVDGRWVDADFPSGPARLANR